MTARLKNTFLIQLRQARGIFIRQATRGVVPARTPREKLEVSLAFLFSRLLGPLPLICLLWLTVAVKSGIGFWKALWVYPLIFLLSIALPLGLTTYLVVSGRVPDLDWSRLSDRNHYLPPIVLLASLTLLVLTYLLTSATIFHLSLLLVTIFLAETAISLVFHFKISAHMAMAVITLSSINLFFSEHFLWLYLLILPLAWARHRLRVHTAPELLAGITVTLGIIIAAVAIFGLPRVP